ncbi:MAG: hypothetical protein NTX98_00275, partial [Candidatus Doudnabacteria bacterium]|nr:hypothetical protein [Candidatus Doudnabacteria bacterium]
YCYYFNNHDFQAIGCRDLDLLFYLIKEVQPHLLVVNIKFLEDGRFERLKRYFPWAKILSIGYNSDAGAVKKAMACGASSHIDRKTTKPMDIVHVAKSILEY